MTRLAATLVLLFSVFLGGCKTIMTDHKMNSKIDTLVRSYYPDDNLPGCSVLVVNHGWTIFEKSYGLADVENKIPATPQTNYRIASVTKQFTARLIAILEEEGKLSRNDSVRKYIPEFPDSAQPITIDHLLHHTSGLKDYEELYSKDITVPLHDADVIKLLAAQTSGDFPPGEKFSYSNSGYATLAIVAERATGQRFADLLREKIFLPVGMENTIAFENGISTVSNRAYGYEKQGEAWVLADQSMTSAVLGDGGIYTSIADYAKWDRALREMSGSPKSLPAIVRAYTPAKLNDGKSTGYGQGWFIELKNGNVVVQHGGSTIGFNHMVRRIPEIGFAVVVFSNHAGPEPKELAQKIEDLVLDTHSATP